MHFFKTQKKSGGMAQGKQEVKFERNPTNRFWGNCNTDGGPTTDKDPYYNKLCWPSQAEIKTNRYDFSLQNVKYPKRSFVRTIGKKIQEKFWKLSAAICRRNSVLNFFGAMASPINESESEKYFVKD